MIDELIEEIRRVEKQADEDIRGSVQRAKEIESEANNRAAEIDAKNKTDLRKMRQNAVAKANEKAEIEYRAIITAAEAQRDTLGTDKKRIDGAIKLIADGILK